MKYIYIKFLHCEAALTWVRQITGLSQKMVLTNDIVIIDIQAMSFFTSYQSISKQSISILIFAYYQKVSSSPEVKILLLSTSSMKIYLPMQLSLPNKDKLSNKHILGIVVKKLSLVIWTGPITCWPVGHYTQAQQFKQTQWNLLLADCTFCCGLYPTGKLSVDAGSQRSEV